MSGQSSYLREIAHGGFRPEDADRFLALWQRLEAAYMERLCVATAPHRSWRARFRAAAVETAELVEDHPSEARFLAVDALTAGELGRTCRATFGRRIAELLDSAREELDDPLLVPDATPQWILGIFFDRIYRRATGAGPDLPSQVPELLFLAVSAYFGTEAGLEELARRG